MESTAVTTRSSSDTEQPYQSGDAMIPLVIEPRPGFEKPSHLIEFLSSNSENTVRAIYEHGAVLFRGFGVAVGEEIAQVTRSIKGLLPLSGYFLEERGRMPFKGSTTLYYTNRYVKYGGSFKKIGGVHGENYPHADVPAFQSLWCRREPRVGGETAIIQMADVYDELDDSLRARLEQKAFETSAKAFSDIAQRYAIPEPVVATLCAEVGLPVVSHDGGKFAVVRKPSVFRHPYTKRLSLQINLSVCRPGFDEELRKHLELHYRSLGWKWFLHRWGCGLDYATLRIRFTSGRSGHRSRIS